jgi:uncharacterized membrane protein
MKAIRAIVLSAIVTVGNAGIALSDDETHDEHEHSGYVRETYGEHEHSQYSCMGGRASQIMVVAALLLAATALVVSLTAKRHRNRNSDPEDVRKREALDNLEGQILAMLTEYGGSLTQDAIQDNLGLPIDVVASTLLEMEKAGQITREWESKKYTFRVGSAPKGP